MTRLLSGMRAVAQSTVSVALVDGASLAVFRVAFGLVMVWESYRYLSKGWVTEYFVAPLWNFPYVGFEWVVALPGDGMHWLFVLLGVAGLFIALGLYYRTAAILFLPSFTYIFLIDQAVYLNHFYLVLLIATLLAVAPLHRCYSVDGAASPQQTCPAWVLWLFRFQFGLVYLFAGVAKINGDWLAGEPLTTWLADHAILSALPEFQFRILVSILAWGGLIVDLLMWPALVYARTRPFAVACAVLFHVTNKLLFNIGIFPLLAISGTLLFLDPDWPRRLAARLRRQGVPPLGAHGVAGRAPIAFIAVWIASQLILPLRHHFIPGDVAWTEEGHRFSWRMKLRQKTGELRFDAFDPVSGEAWSLDQNRWLSRFQIEKMLTRPELIYLFAHRVNEEYRATTGRDFEVRIHCMARLNGRGPCRLIDRDVDLIRVSLSWWSDSWVTRGCDAERSVSRL